MNGRSRAATIAAFCTGLIATAGAVVSGRAATTAPSPVAQIASPTTSGRHGAALIVQRSRVAGLRHHAGPPVWSSIEPGSAVELVREAANPHDARAIRVDWRDIALGYLPRRDNDAVAWALDRGERLSARIYPHPGTRPGRFAFDVEILLR